MSILAKPIALLAAAVVGGLLWVAPGGAAEPPVLFGIYTDSPFFPGACGDAKAQAVNVWKQNS